MPLRQARPLPTVLLMTDERMGDALWDALARVPRGAGVVFRHRSLVPAERRALYDRVRAVARRRQLRLILAGSPRQAIAWRADGVHGRSPHRASRPLLRSAPAHDGIELRAAHHADLILVSPVYPTRSHPGAPTLGLVRLGLLIGRDRSGIVALGGMNDARARSLRRLGVRRWAGIDGWSGGGVIRT
ncbi:thiamine phosphate synthase [Sphingomonas abietis]|uniref:Thiamine phosphate synthase n=1 Tax=Sphingomonas abietis TaxID=3012344 RepID=A0ABY7NPT4_9SPHN|nr:thiamine phosphate synthase [Sphingomonas abietis]WBO22582.1 thiamine phosphate synthase [Sphingomonas abietis]